jgi:hypothetical protein
MAAADALVVARTTSGSGIPSARSFERVVGWSKTGPSTL